MSSTGAGYDLAANIYSPDGRVFQIEYGGKAVEASGYVHPYHFFDAYLCFIFIFVLFDSNSSGSLILIIMICIRLFSLLTYAFAIL